MGRVPCGGAAAKARRVKHLFFDTETEPFAPAYMAPEVVCLQYCRDTGAPVLLHARADRAALIGVVRDALRDPDCMLVGHNVAYDLVCLAALEPDLLPLMFAAYEDNRVTDTMFRQKLADIARGRYRTRQYNLADCCDIHDYVPADGGAAFKLDEAGKKSDPWRIRYGELMCVALHYWPASAVRYALNDATATRHVYQSQEQRYAREWICDEFNQARKFFCLRLMEVWGIRTDARGVASLENGAREELESVRGLLVEYGLVRDDGTRNMLNVRARIVEAYAAQGKDYPRPKATKGKPQSNTPCTDNDACEQSDDYVLRQYAKFSQMTKVLSNDVPMLAGGMVHPIHTHFDIVESGRTSSASPNIQNPRRMTGVRECFVPRDGKAYVENDMSALELRTVAQACIKIVGFSKLADVLNAGQDPHTKLAAQMLGQSYEWVEAHIYEPEVSERRTGAKGMNFGFPGGLGAKSFPAFAWRAYKFRITEAEVAQRKEEWLAALPEFRPYHRFIGETYESGVRHLFTNRLRGRVTFTAAANSYFQGLGADVCGGSLWAVTKACYVVRSSYLYGSRPVNFMHDSVLTETDVRNVHDALREQDRLMCEGGAPYLPDVPPKADGKAMMRWSKDAARITRDGTKNGEVVAWSPVLGIDEPIDAYAARMGTVVGGEKDKGCLKSYGAQVKALIRAAEKKAT